jgi:hypothetical protein
VSESWIEVATKKAIQEFNLWRVEIKNDFEKASLQAVIKVFC